MWSGVRLEARKFPKLYQVTGRACYCCHWNPHKTVERDISALGQLGGIYFSRLSAERTLGVHPNETKPGLRTHRLDCPLWYDYLPCCNLCNVQDYYFCDLEVFSWDLHIDLFCEKTIKQSANQAWINLAASHRNRKGNSYFLDLLISISSNKFI